MRFLVIFLLVVAVGVGFAMSFSGGANSGRDEFGTKILVEGTLREHPYGMLEADDGEATDGLPGNVWLLTGDQKTDASDEIAGLDGHRVRIQGTRIFRENLVVFEVFTIEDLGRSDAASPPQPNPVPQTLRGEIVDTKCALGRMKPGSGVVHRECAIRCIQGGIPPTLMTTTTSGSIRFYLLEDLEGRPVHEAVIPHVAYPIEIQGQVYSRGNFPVLRFDPSGLKH